MHALEARELGVDLDDDVPCRLDNLRSGSDRSSWNDRSILEDLGRLDDGPVEMLAVGRGLRLILVVETVGQVYGLRDGKRCERSSSYLKLRSKRVQKFSAPWGNMLKCLSVDHNMDISILTSFFRLCCSLGSGEDQPAKRIRPSLIPFEMFLPT